MEAYRDVSTIGTGSRGTTVLKATLDADGRTYALKKFGLEIPEPEIRREYAMAKKMAQLGVGGEVYDLFDDGIGVPGIPSEWFMRMEYFEHNLDSYLATRPADVAWLERAIVDRLRTMLVKGYLCVDIKPENILVDAKGRRVVLADFDGNFCHARHSLRRDGALIVRAFCVILCEHLGGRAKSPIFRAERVTREEVKHLKETYADVDHYGKLRHAATSATKPVAAPASATKPVAAPASATKPVAAPASADARKRRQYPIKACTRATEGHPCYRMLDARGIPIRYTAVDPARISVGARYHCDVTGKVEGRGAGTCRRLAQKKWPAETKTERLIQS